MPLPTTLPFARSVAPFLALTRSLCLLKFYPFFPTTYLTAKLTVLNLHPLAGPPSQKNQGPQLLATCTAVGALFGYQVSNGGKFQPVIGRSLHRGLPSDTSRVYTIDRYTGRLLALSLIPSPTIVHHLVCVVHVLLLNTSSFFYPFSSPSPSSICVIFYIIYIHILSRDAG